MKLSPLETQEKYCSYMVKAKELWESFTNGKAISSELSVTILIKEMVESYTSNQLLKAVSTS